jgi:tRNA (adenine37-N6)-methyltransferase
VLDGAVLLSGIDLVDQTPIVDIKPYHLNDYLSSEDMGIPQWISDSKEVRLKVSFTPKTEEEIHSLYRHTNYISTPEMLRQLIFDILSLNPHTLHTEGKEDSVLLAIEIDTLTIVYQFSIQLREVVVHRIELTDKSVKLRA